MTFNKGAINGSSHHSPTISCVSFQNSTSSSAAKKEETNNVLSLVEMICLRIKGTEEDWNILKLNCTFLLTLILKCTCIFT